jgi:hypothetical protein
MCPAYRLSPFHRRDVASLRALKVTFRGGVTRLSRQHRLAEPAAAQIAAKLAYLRDVETKLLLVGSSTLQAIVTAIAGAASQHG